MRNFHNIQVSVFIHDNEDEEKILKKLKELFPFKIEKYLIREEATGIKKDKIIIYKVKIDKQSLTNKFMKHLVEQFNDKEKERLYFQLTSRLDDELNFFIRLDKKELLNDKFVLTDSGNCYHIKALVAAYPKRKEEAEEIIARYLNVQK